MLEVLSEKFPRAHLLIVDDASTDGTQEAVRGFTDERGSQAHIHLLERQGDLRGISASIADALQHCQTEFFLVMDADFQHPPEVIQKSFFHLESGADVVVFSRQSYLSGLSPLRATLSFLATFFARRSLKKKDVLVRDPLSGFFGGRTELAKFVLKSSMESFELKGYKFLFDFLRNIPQGRDVKEIGFSFAPRLYGRSKLKTVHGLYFLRSIFQ